MTSTTVNITTEDGVVDCHVFHPSAGGPWPAVLMYMDGPGIRPDLLSMGERLASNNYYVLLPNLYYRAGHQAPFDPAVVFTPGPERERLLAMVYSLNNSLIRRDTAAFLDFLDTRELVAGKKIGCVGYCMGGAFALTAAGVYPDRVAAAASFHGARLATDSPDSPHLLAGKMRAKVYVGVAEIDPSFPAEECERLKAALSAAGVRYTVDIYPGVRHGFAVTGMPVYDREASERHWRELLQLFRETLE